MLVYDADGAIDAYDKTAIFKSINSESTRRNGIMIL